MYYLARGGGVPTPAEAPCRATVDGKYEWEYGQVKHQAALRNIKGLVDQSVPSSIDERRLEVQARTRRFCVDQRRAETGRENRKLIEKLVSISKGSAGADPRGPPQSSTLRGSTLGSSLRSGGGSTRLSATLSASGSLIGEPGKSLNETQRRKTQRCIEQDNAALLGRILAVKPTFNKKADDKSFDRHRRAVQLLQRHGDTPGQGGMRRTRSQPLTKHMRPPGKLVGPAQGLEALLLPEDLHRSVLPSGLSGSQHEAASPEHSPRRSASPAHSPIGSASPAQSQHSYQSSRRSSRRSSPQKSSRGSSYGSRTPRSDYSGDDDDRSGGYS